MTLPEYLISMSHYGATAQTPPFGSPTKAAARTEPTGVEVEAQAEESVYELYEPLADGGSFQDV